MMRISKVVVQFSSLLVVSGKLAQVIFRPVSLSTIWQRNRTAYLSILNIDTTGKLDQPSK